MDERSTGTAVLATLRRAPAWLRADIASPDAALRERAEETLAAMIASALDASAADVQR